MNKNRIGGVGAGRAGRVTRSPYPSSASGVNSGGEQLREANERLAQSEERFRDLFEEAPIAYVYEDVNSRTIQANRTAMRILGLKPEDIASAWVGCQRVSPR